MRLSSGCRLPILISALFLAGCMGSDGARAQGPAAVEGFLQQGEYDQAIEALEDQIGSPRSPQIASQLAELLMVVGRFDDAETLLEGALADNPRHTRLLLLTGRLLGERGRLDEAMSAFAEAEQAGTDGNTLLARMHRGEILLRTGEQQAAFALFDEFIDVYNRSSSLGVGELLAVAGAVRQLEVTDSALLQDALRAYDEALALDPDNLEAHLGIGTLFVRTYQTADARDAFREVLRRRARDPRALVGMATASQVEGSSQAGDLVDQALEVNPALVPALTLRARIRLAGEDLEGAEDDLSTALEVDPTSSDALAISAAARYLQDQTDEFESLTARALEINPRDAAFFVTLSDLVSTRRYYAQAVEFADRGVRLDSLSWAAYGAKGLNQLRTGEMAQGRMNLEVAFEGDPYNLWFKNTLDLLDTMDSFERTDSDRISVFVDPEDGEALSIYLLEIGDRAYQSLAARYGYRPETPIRVEAFRRSADFSVRTVGLAGLGALGVAFGTVVAMDSPAARGAGGYHWASTLWHEMAHVVHLGMTGHRVPRWLSEGLAVHEERLAGPGWGSRPSLPFLAAYTEERLRPPSELSQSFVRPRFPEEVGFAYVLGSLVSEWIESEWGFEGLRGMLQGYGEGLSHERVLQRELGVDSEAFDERFDEWLRGRYPSGFAAAEAALELRDTEEEDRRDPEWLRDRVERSPRDLESRLALARLLLEEERGAEAEALLIQARDIFPENPDPRGPNRLLAGIRLERGDTLAAIEALESHVAIVAEDYEALLQLAQYQEDRGNAVAAAEALERAIQVYPFEIPVHGRLAGLHRENGQFAAEIRERRVVLALGPVDRTGALYELAQALYAAGDLEEARRVVLDALALAPRFPEAQELLLRIMSDGGGGR